jgi:hypothetical protein
LLASPSVPPDELPAAVIGLVEQLSSVTSAATAAVLSAVRDSSAPPALALAHEAATAAIAISSTAGQAGIQTFLARSRK